MRLTKSLRFTLPLRLVRPYLFAGVGGVFAATFAKKWSVEKDGKPAYTSGP